MFQLPRQRFVSSVLPCAVRIQEQVLRLRRCLRLWSFTRICGRFWRNRFIYCLLSKNTEWSISSILNFFSFGTKILWGNCWFCYFFTDKGKLSFRQFPQSVRRLIEVRHEYMWQIVHVCPSITKYMSLYVSKVHFGSFGFVGQRRKLWTKESKQQSYNKER